MRAGKPPEPSLFTGVESTRETTVVTVARAITSPSPYGWMHQAAVIAWFMGLIPDASPTRVIARRRTPKRTNARQRAASTHASARQRSPTRTPTRGQRDVGDHKFQALLTNCETRKGTTTATRRDTTRHYATLLHDATRRDATRCQARHTMRRRRKREIRGESRRRKRSFADANDRDRRDRPLDSSRQSAPARSVYPRKSRLDQRGPVRLSTAARQVPSISQPEDAVGDG